VVPSHSVTNGLSCIRWSGHSGQETLLEIAGATTSRAEARHRQVDDRDSEYQLELTLRPEQARLDAIVAGAERGRYCLLTGEKGTGKSSMLLEAMRKVDGEGISMFEAHADLEVFRVRLGKALELRVSRRLYRRVVLNTRAP
jgi:predicted ATP-dependent serine protease